MFKGLQLGGENGTHWVFTRHVSFVVTQIECFTSIYLLVNPSLGPMARDLETLVLGFKSVVVPKMWQLDPYVARIPFNEEVHIYA